MSGGRKIDDSGYTYSAVPWEAIWPAHFGYGVTWLGASNLLTGYAQSISSLASGITQLLGGRLTDKWSKRVAVATISNAIIGVMWIVAAIFSSPLSLVFSYIAIALASGFYTAGWSSLIGKTSEGKGRGSFLARYAMVDNVASLVALVATTMMIAINPSFSPFPARRHDVHLIFVFPQGTEGA